MVCSDSLLIDAISIILALSTVVIAYFRWAFSYWKDRNVPTLNPTIPLGDLPDPFKNDANLGVVMKRWYDEFRAKKALHGGIYMMARPTYFVVDLDYLKNILTKDFQHFVDRGFYYNEEKDPLSAHLFSINGQKWKNLRAKLTPTFTSGKMKMMFQTLLNCEKNLQEKLESLHESNTPVDIKELLSCYTTDIIGSCAFGFECNTFKDEESLFRKYGKMALSYTLLERMKIFFVMSFPKIGKSLGMTTTPKESADFFMNVTKETVEYREKNNYTRKDFMQLLIDLKNNKLAVEEGYKHDGKTLTIEEIAAQSFIFFVGGFETSSTTMTFALYELAKNQEVQQKVRNEINTVLAKYNGEVTYEAIHDMKYMGQVINETLRKYPPLPFITRQCVKDYKLSDQDVIIQEGTRVMIPILGIHRDEQLYPNPEKFDPERFNEENSKNRHQYAHIPFGEGPRNCIGLRFGVMQTKVGLTSVLRKYKFTVNNQTHEPIDFDVNSFVLAADGDIWLDAAKI